MALTEEAIAARAAIKQELGVLFTEMRSLGKRRMQPQHIAFAAEVLAFQRERDAAEDRTERKETE